MARGLSLLPLALLVGCCGAFNPYETDDFKYYCETFNYGVYVLNPKHVPGKRDASKGINEPTKCTFDLLPDRRAHDDPQEMCEEAMPYVITSATARGATVSCTAIETQLCPSGMSIGEWCFKYETTPTTFAAAKADSVLNKNTAYFRRWITALGFSHMAISWMDVEHASPAELGVRLKLEIHNGVHYFKWLTEEELERKNLPFALLLYQPTDFHVSQGDLVAVVDTSIKLPYFKNIGGKPTEYMPKFLCDKMGGAMGMQAFYFEDTSTRNGKHVDEWGNAIRPKCFFITSNSHNIKSVDGNGMKKLHEQCPTLLGVKTEPAVFHDPYIVKQVSKGFVAKMQDKQAPLAVRLAAAHVYTSKAWSSAEACKKCNAENGFCENRVDTMLWYFFGPNGKPILHVNGGLWAYTRLAPGGSEYYEVVYPIKQCGDVQPTTAVLDMRLEGLVNLGPERRLPILCMAETHSSYENSRSSAYPDYNSHVAYMNKHNLQTACKNIGGLFLGTSCVVQERLHLPGNYDAVTYDDKRHDLQLMLKHTCKKLKGFKVNFYEPTHEQKSLKIFQHGLIGIIAAIRNPIIPMKPGHTDDTDSAYKYVDEKTGKSVLQLRKEFKYIDEFGRATESFFDNPNLWYGDQPNANGHPYRENCVRSNGRPPSGLFHDYSCKTVDDYLCEYKNDLVVSQYKKEVKYITPL